MNPSKFEYSPTYLSHIAYNTYTNKYFELITSLKDEHLVPRQKLLSMFQPHQFKRNRMFVNAFYVVDESVPMMMDPTQIRIWKEYFGRYDEETSHEMHMVEHESSSNTRLLAFDVFQQMKRLHQNQ